MENGNWLPNNVISVNIAEYYSNRLSSLLGCFFKIGIVFMTSIKQIISLLFGSHFSYLLSLFSDRMLN